MRIILPFLLIIALWIPCVSALAQVDIRLGQNQDYSRLVFDWGAPVTYTLKEQASGKLLLSFDRPASPRDIAAKTDEIIKTLEITSTDPLKITIAIPAGAKYRDFSTGQRVMIDVYGKRTQPVAAAPEPESKPEPTPESQKPAVKKPEPKAEPKAEPKTEAKAEPKPEPQTPAPAPAPGPHAVPVAGVEAEDPGAEDLEKPILEQLHSKTAKPHQITFSSTDSIGMAVFQIGKELFMVNDRPDMLMNPHVGGPNPEQFTPLQSKEIEGGKSFKVNLPSSPSKVRGQGGGLLWRIVISDTEDKRVPVKPERKNVPGAGGEASRGGSLFIPLKNARKHLQITHPETGKPLHIITVASAKQFTGTAYDFVDLEIIPSAVGMAFIIKNDNLEVKLGEEGVSISNPSGLALMSDDKISAAATRSVDAGARAAEDTRLLQTRIFDFEGWKMGAIESLDSNKNIIIGSLAGQTPEARVEGLVTLAKMYLSNGMWAEALGFLNLAQSELPALKDNPEFQALKGATQALGYSSEDAFNTLSLDVLKPFEEINYWRAYALADLGDWQQAREVMPRSFNTLTHYPAELAKRLSTGLAEVALRAGALEDAQTLLDITEDHKDSFTPPDQAAYDYLMGELARQKGDAKKTAELWKPLAEGKDNLYRAKAGLALTRLQIEKGDLKPEQAIDNLERLRYAWRGDELETQIHYWLGKTYFETKDYVKGLNIMRDAVAFSSNSILAPRITQDMTTIFTSLFNGPDLATLSPLDAATIYGEFSELVPAGEEGDVIVEKLAERLVQADLLTRAAEILQNQVDYRLTGPSVHRVGTRLAAIYLINKQPAKAQAVLEKALKSFQESPAEYQTADRRREIALLMAQSMAGKGRAVDALAFLENLPPHPDVNRLRADIAWRGSYWDDAAVALNDVILDSNISLTRPLSIENANLILQRAVAINLAGDRISLANMRERYSDAMASSEKAKVFEIVTRPRQSSALADRETLMSIVSEVDLFSDFLESYKGAQAPKEAPPPAQATPQEETQTPEGAQTPPQ